MSGRSMSLDVLVRLRDHLSGPLRALKNNLAQIGNFARRIGILGAAIGAISFMGPMKEAAAFQQQLLDIAGTAELAGKAAFGFVDQAGRQYEDLALKIGQYSQTVAEGAGQMVAAGVDRKLIDATIGDIGRAATAANANFADMASVGTSMLNNLKLPADEMRDSLGALVVAGKLGAFELKDMAATFPGLTSGVAKFGVKGREAVNFLASALQIARKGTADPGQAANNLGNFLDKALSPLTKKNFKKAGVDIEAVMMDAATKGLNPIEAVIQKIGKLTGVSEDAIAGYMKKAKQNGLEGAEALGFVREQLEAIGAAGKIGELFQDKQVLDFLIPFMANIEEYKAIKEKVAAATGAAIDADFETQMAGINRELMVMQEIGTQAVRMTGLAFAEWLPQINDWLLTALRWVRDLDGSTGGLVKKVLSFAGAGLMAVSALGVLGVALPIVGAGLAAIGGLIGVLLSPIGLFVAALAGGAAYIWKHWERFGPRIMRLWDRAKRGFTEFAAVVGARGRELVNRYGPMIAAGLERGWQQAIALGRRYGPRIRDSIVSGWAELKAATSDFASGFGSQLDGIGAEWDELVGKLAGIGGKVKGIAEDIWSIFSKMPGAEKFNWNFIGEAVGKGLKGHLALLGELAGVIDTVLAGVKGLTDWLAKSEPGSWGNLISEKVAETAAMLANPIGRLLDYVQRLVGFLQGVTINWSSLLPQSAVDAANTIAAAINAAVDAVERLRGLMSIENLLPPGVGDAKKAGEAGAAIGGMVGPPTPAPAAPDRRSSLEGGGTRFAAAVPPVRLDGNVNVRVAVEGPGKVIGAASDNSKVTVGNNGRAVGRV